MKKKLKNCKLLSSIRKITIIEVLEIIPIIGLFISVAKENNLGNSMIRNYHLIIILYHIFSAIYLTILLV